MWPFGNQQEVGAGRNTYPFVRAKVHLGFDQPIPVLRDGENQSDFMREAVELELRRREGPPVGGPDRS